LVDDANEETLELPPAAVLAALVKDVQEQGHGYP